MTTVGLVSTPQEIAAFRTGLERSFGGWGNDTAFGWYFERRAGGPRADLLAIHEGGATLAGTGVTYRQVRLENGALLPAGIVTSTWTVPEARRQGHFRRLIEAAAERAEERGAGLLLAFVSTRNASYRGLLRDGWAFFPAQYIYSTPATPRPRDTVRLERMDRPGTRCLERLAEESMRRRLGRTHFVYEDFPTWAAQFWHRPYPTELLCGPAGSWTIVERTPAADRLQLLTPGESPRHFLAALLARSIARNRQLFFYSTGGDLAPMAASLGLAVEPGHVAARRAHSTTLAQALGDDLAWTAADSSPLAEPGGRSFLGRWHLDSGDRM